MKLRAESEADQSQRESASQCFRAGREYLVVTIHVAALGVWLRVVDEQGAPGMWDGRLFETTGTRIPESWTVDMDERAWMDIGPQSWHGIPYFWEDYFDGERRAVDAYEREMQAMIRADTVPDEPGKV